MVDLFNSNENFILFLYVYLPANRHCFFHPQVIIGFRKEQVNANLLNGKGEIKDVSLNCSMFNEYIAKVCPYIRVEEIHVSRLGFHVTSWTNLRKAPIIVDIGHMTAKIEEPLSILPPEQRRRLQMITEGELMQKIAEGFKPFRGSGAYGLVDRIVDNMAIEIESFRVDFQTWGKFKTRRVGPWTPPLLQMELKNLKICMVDAEGCEWNPDQVCAHNQSRRDTCLAYKKVTGECKILVVPHTLKEEDSVRHVLPNMNLEVQIAVERRLRDGAVLACQLDVTIPEVDVDIDTKDIRQLAHLASGFQYCFAKDRSFQDPLKSIGESDKVSSFSINGSVVDRATVERGSSKVLDDVQEIGNGVKYDEIDEERTNSNECTSEDDCSATSSPTDDGTFEDDTTEVQAKDRSKSERSVIALPNGLVIWKSVSLTCSIEKLVVWASYPGDEEEGCLEFVAKGCIAEAIWPKANREHGLYVQMSTSFVSLEERVGPHQRVLLLAGMQRDDNFSLHLPSRKPQEIDADEFFPLFERRSIRDDPLDLRHLFPSQALGVKTTIDILKLSKDGTDDRFMVSHEIGGDEIEVVLDTDVILRMTKLILNADGEGFDPRWDTGDWSEYLTSDMLCYPSETLLLDDYLQDYATLFLDENMMISSDLFNVTARFSNVVIRIPSVVQDSLRSCDIIVKCKEATFVVSSDLPRTFLTGRIGNSISGEAQEDSEEGIIDFPNDPSDVCYRCEQGFSGVSTSTFRMQLTPRGIEVNIVPTIPFCNAPEPQKFVSITESTMIFCFDGEAPKDGSNKLKITLFLSILIQELIVNVDFDILAGATCTLLSHKKRIVEILEIVDDVFGDSPCEEATVYQSDTPKSIETDKIEQSFNGRRIVTTRHVAQSRETGGLAIIFCLQQKHFRIRVWRQNVPIRSPLRDNSNSSGLPNCQDDGGLIEALNILDFEMEGLEVGVEFDFHSNCDHRTVLKAYLQRANLSVVDLAKEIGSWGKDRNTQQKFINLCSFGDESLLCGLNPSGLAQQFAFRMESRHKNDDQSWSMAVDISAPSTISLDIAAAKEVFILLIEGLLLPAWSDDPIMANEVLLFPPGTIGALFFLVAKELIWTESLCLNDSKNLGGDTQSSDPMLERALQTMCKTFLPHNLRVLLLRCEIANFLINIPFERGNERQQNETVSILLNQSEIITRLYTVPGSPLSDIEQVLACKGTDWSTLIDKKNGGFYQYICSRQSLLSTTEQKGGMKFKTLVNPFEMQFTYSDAKMDLSMGKGISISDIRLIEDVQTRIRSIVTISSECLCDIYHIVGAMMRKPQKMEEDEEKSEGKTFEEEVCQNSNTSFAKTRDLLRKANEGLSQYEISTRNSIRNSNIELERLKIDLFKKDRERFGALSMMSSRVAGWIRMGSQHRSGQRVVKKSLLWPFWAVLRKELLILSRRPGEPKPSDIVSLVDARLRKLAGGNSKQDTKRGFAIVESSGMVRYFVTTNAQEYELWTNEINKTIKSFSDPSKLLKLDDFLDMDTSELTVDSMDNEKGSQRSSVIGNKLSSAFQSARLKGKEVSNRRQSSQSFEQSTLDNESSKLTNDNHQNPETNEPTRGSHVQDTPSKRIEIGKKISEVGLMTKGRLGSVIESARKKRGEISSRRKANDAVEIALEKDADTDVNSIDPPAKLVQRDSGVREQDTDENQGSFATRPGFKLSNKFGSAIQSARMKAKESIDKPSRLRVGELQHDLPADDETKNPQPRSLLEDFSTATVEPTRTGIDSFQSSIKSADIARQEENNRRSSRFSFLKRNDDFQDDELFGGDLLTLKNIYVGEDIKSFANVPQMEEPLKVLKEKWFVKVSEIRETAETSHFDQKRESASIPEKVKVDEKTKIEAESSECKEEKKFSSDYRALGMNPDVSRFLVKVQKIRSPQDCASFEKQWSFGDVLGFYSVVTEAIEATLTQQLGKLSSPWDLSSAENVSKSALFEKVMVCGRVLGGLLEAGKSFDTIQGFRRYQCESMENFLNSLLECPLPINGLSLLAGTLGIDDPMEDFLLAGNESCNGKTSPIPSVDRKVKRRGSNERFSGGDGSKFHLSDDRTVQIFNLLTACEAEIQQINTRNESTKKKESSSTEIRPILYEPLLPPTLTEHIHKSMKKSLKDAMAQRDEAHAQLIGANVMHSNSLERMRRKNERLEIESTLSHEIARAQLKQDFEAPNLTNLFGGPDERIQKIQKEIDRKIEKVHHAIRNDDGDAEMMQLCSQLASEISTKTSLALEIERIESTREIERETELSEKEALQNEMRRLRELLEVERQNSSQALTEAAHWKALYEECRASSHGGKQ